MSRPRAPRQLELPTPPTWGGKRRRAGRKPQGRRARMPHDPRPDHNPRRPCHVTLRARYGIPNLRSRAIFPTLRKALAAASKDAFRVVHFSGAERPRAPAPRGRLAGGAHPRHPGTGHSLRPRHQPRRPPHRQRLVRSLSLARPDHAQGNQEGARHVLLNHCKHLRATPGIDACSSAAWFDGWRHRPFREPEEETATVAARTWAPLHRLAPRRRPDLILRDAASCRCSSSVSWGRSPAGRSPTPSSSGVRSAPPPGRPAPPGLPARATG
jgi:hypothetical protein